MKSLVLGNGNILAALDEYAQVRDFYYPYVGLENHIGGQYAHRIGLFINGTLKWFDDPSWDITVSCDNSAMVNNTKAVNEEMKVDINFSDIIYNEKNILLRKLIIHNKSDERRELKLYFGQEFEISESHREDTAYFDPRSHTVVHYKGRRVFLINGILDGKSFTDYTTGIFNKDGTGGSYTDAEDGILSQNPIDHGLVDSVVGFYFSIGAYEKKELYYWVCAAETIPDAQNMNEYILNTTPAHLLRTTQDFWRAWVNKYNFSFYKLDPMAISLFKKSMLMVRAHTDNRGAIIASSDSRIKQVGRDSYAYMWPRDGAFSAMALDKAGAPNVARRFFEFCEDVITESGYLMHKYGPDRSLGSSWHPWIRNGSISLPIQEDETALIIHALWKHYEISKDLEFVERVYNSLIKNAADFMVEYRDKKTGLPKPSYNLWEEHYGASTFTSSAVYGALKAAANFAKILGKNSSWRQYNDAAEEVREAIIDQLYDEETGNFYKLINTQDGKVIPDKTIDMSSVYGVFAFGVMDIDDERLTQAVSNTEKALWCKTKRGGIPRYEGDIYYKTDADTPGNPWINTTLWLAQYYIAKAKKESDFEPAKKLIYWATEHALPSGVLPEQIDPVTGAPLSATPLTWSHAEYVITIVNYLDKLEELGICDACDPVRT